MYLSILSCRYRITHYVAVAYIHRRLLWQPVMHMHPWSFVANVLSDCRSMALDQKSDATTCIASTWMHMNSSIKYNAQHIFFVTSGPTCGNAEVIIKTALNRQPAPHMASFAWKMAQHLQSQLKDNERCLSWKLSLLFPAAKPRICLRKVTGQHCRLVRGGPWHVTIATCGRVIRLW